MKCVANVNLLAAAPLQPVIPKGCRLPPCARATCLPSLASSPTWTLCLYLICRIGESHTGGLNCLPTNYASAQNVIGPRGTARRHPHSFGFLRANEARRKKRRAAPRCAACGWKATSLDRGHWWRVRRVRVNAEVVFRGEGLGY